MKLGHRKYFIYLILVGINISGCLSTIPEAYFYEFNNNQYVVHFFLKEKGIFGNRHNPFSIEPYTRYLSFCLLTSDTIGIIELNNSEFSLSCPPRRGYNFIPNSRHDSAKTNRGYFKLTKNSVELNFNNPTSSYNGKYRLIRLRDTIEVESAIRFYFPKFEYPHR